MNAYLDIVKHGLVITGFVTVMMVVIEYLNVITRGDWQSRLVKSPWGQYVVAAFLGATPGCLGSFTVVSMYTHGMLTHGAVIACMVATMGDESFVMMALLPGPSLGFFTLLFFLGIVAGAISDPVARRWISLKPVACKNLNLHDAETCHCLPRGQLRRQWRDCSPVRGIMAAGLMLFILALSAGYSGPPEWDWTRISLLAVSGVAVFIVSTVPEHFLVEHLWKHAVRRHVPKLFLWTISALAVMHFIEGSLYLEESLQRNGWILMVAACVMGLIPESGPHLIFLTLYVEGNIPFGVLLASSIVQDGHGMLPLLAHSRRAFLGVKAVNFLFGIAIGAIALLLEGL